MAYVYKHIRPDIEEVFYVGVGTDTEGKYERAYCLWISSRNKHWREIVEEVGVGNIRVEIMYDNLTIEQALEKERDLVSFYGRKNLNTGPLVNLTRGGEKNAASIRTEGWINKIAASATGRQHSDDTKEKLRKIMLTRRDTPETKKKKAVTWKNRNHSEETKKKISEAKKGKSKSTVRRSVLNLETGIFYDTVAEAARAHNMYHVRLYERVMGKRCTGTPIENNTSFILI
jgi:hypothetical protein